MSNTPNKEPSNQAIKDTQTSTEKDIPSLDKYKEVLRNRNKQYHTVRQNRQQRVKDMARLHLEDKLTLHQIGIRYGISRQRVHQLLNEFAGITKP